jgi:hypothetical protein
MIIFLQTTYLKEVPENHQHHRKVSQGNYREESGHWSIPNEASLLRLATAILIEISDEWETGRKYMTVKELIRL